jgi:tetratricopeptide (TPR) repeat protein
MSSSNKGWSTPSIGIVASSPARGDVADGSSRVYDLSAARPDAWFDEILKQSSDFERACQIIGRSTLGLGLVAGARIASITPSQHAQNLTMVEFSIGSDPTIESVALPEFRETIARLLLTPLQTGGLDDDPDIEALQAHIGGRYMLEAALFAVRPIQLRHDLGLSEITLEFNGVRHVLSLEDFRDVIDERVRAELGLGQQDDGMAIDLALVDQAERSNANQSWATTISMLTPWLTPISMLLRTGEANELGEDVHRRLSDALDLLGTAYANVGDLDAANEVLRLGVQWAGESSKAADLFLALGRASVAGEKHGEAIGLLRRAIRLGAAEDIVMPLLAKSLAARDQALAAMVCLARARALGADEDVAEEIGPGLAARFGDAWPRFEAWMKDAK